MTQVHCPNCKKLLFKADFAKVEIMCKCGRLIKINIFTQKALLLTPEKEADNIETIEKDQ